jgi:hypothetical protein
VIPSTIEWMSLSTILSHIDGPSQIDCPMPHHSGKRNARGQLAFMLYRHHIPQVGVVGVGAALRFESARSENRNTSPSRALSAPPEPLPLRYAFQISRSLRTI